MSVTFWKGIRKNGGWFWTCFAPNGEIIADSAEEYSSMAKAVRGAEATAREFAKWQKETSTPKTPKGSTSGRLTPVGKRSTLSSSQIRKTAKRGG